MLLKNSYNELKKYIKNDNILSQTEELYCYSQDASNIKGPTPLPDLVIFPETIEDVQNILKYANLHNIPVVARGAGTNMVGACICNKGGIVLNFSKMNKILEFNPKDMTMRVQPGTILEDIKKLAETEHLFYPPDPSNYKVSTIGGSIAQSSGGAKSFKYGTTKDYILSLTLVLADGTLVKFGTGTVKDAVGYHLSQLIVGSEGTLAIVVEAELKLIPLPESNAVITAYFDTIEDATFAVNDIIKERIFPATIDFMDNNSINTVERFYPCGLQTQKECLLLIEVDGFKSSIQEQISKIEQVVARNNATYIISANEREQIDAIWTARRSSYGATAKLAPDVVSDDIIVPRSHLSEMVTGCKNICKKYNLQVCIVGHVGDGNIHPQIALNLENDDEFKNLSDAKSEMYALVMKLGGSISAEHGVGIEKLPFINNVLDSTAVEYMKQIKRLFDPNNILNPGKVFNI